MRFGPLLRSVADMCRSSARAAPRAVARESAIVNDFSESGELSGRLMVTAPGGITAPCAARLAAPKNTIAAVSVFTLLHIYFRHRYITRFRVRVSSSQGSLRTYRVGHAACAGVHQAECLVAGPALNSIRRGLHHRLIRPGPQRRGPLQQQPRPHQRQHAGQGQRGAGAAEQRPIAKWPAARAHARSGGQPQADIGAHLRGDAVPRYFGDLVQFGQRLAEFAECGHFRGAAFATGKVARGLAARHPAEIAAGVQCQNFLTRVHHGVYRFLLSMYRRSLVRALAICERTVAFEQSSMLATSSAGKPSTSRNNNPCRSRGLNRRNPSSRYARCSPRSSSCSGLSAWLTGASSISQNVARELRRRKSIAVFVAILDNQCAAFCSSLSCSWCCSALIKVSCVRSCASATLSTIL